ncbi:hypothetical protein C2845_PM13G08310 [Panicum miliaceum]|uniref:Uncharacterized protein n=1 Tax=Panicum miliaceum TaxID=4540 RepID=A0A3L6RLC5_PANMI|nr:hypothetical protein C2845_PM13G08310 [Panicum miliaceum]
MDPNSTFLLNIKLLGNRRKARKDMRCFAFEKVVDSDLINYKDFIESVVEQCPPGYLEVAYIQYYDESSKTFPEVKCDKELMSMFEKHMQQKVVLYCDPSQPYEPITEWPSDDQSQPQNSIEDDDDSYLRNPLPHNEHVGVDEETMYLEKEPILAIVCADKEKDQDYVPECGNRDEDEESEDESEDEDEHEVLSDEELLGQHKCPICQDFGHHWHKCKKGNPDDIAAMMEIRGPPKKKKKTTNSAHSSIVPIGDGAPQSSMTFPPSQSLETTIEKKGASTSGASNSQSLDTTNNTKNKRKRINTDSAASKRCRSRSGSNQPEPISEEHEQTNAPPKEKAKRKGKVKQASKKITKIPMPPLDSPAMATRSKKLVPSSPSMSTRSKRRLNL